MAVSPESRAFFEATPWCKQYFNDPTLKPLIHSSRQNKHFRADTFISKTLNSPDAIAHWQVFYRPPVPGSGNRFGEMYHLISIGSDLNGHIDKAHGGLISGLFDETMGNASREVFGNFNPIYTLYLRVEYKKPVQTPGVVLCRAWLDNEKTEGKKIYSHSSLEDGYGTVLATGEALFIQKDAPVNKARL